MIISVASGKGGTGKTTVATNLAAALDGKVTFIDCDVEEPNAHLFLKPVMQHQQPVYTFLPEIDQSRCDLCRKCSEICRFGALTVVGKSVLLFPELCHGCTGCQRICPQQCIGNGKRQLGHVESGRAGHIDFHHGVLRIGEAMAPPLIHWLRNTHQTPGTVIIDAPPGTSCPVIAAMHGADYVVLVTEPTPFGLHDLILAHQTVTTLNMSCGLVINRANLGDDSVHRYATENDLPILLEIPFSRKVAKLYSHGLLLVRENEEWRQLFAKLFETIAGETTAMRHV